MEPDQMPKDTKFKPGQSGNQQTKFKLGNPHRWQPGQSGNPAGIARSRLQFKESFYAALRRYWRPADMSRLSVKG
jgi:hypothetical protein